MKCPAPAPSHPLRSWSAVPTYAGKALNCGLLLMTSRTNPQLRFNLQIEMSHLLKCTAHQVIAVTTPAQRQGHLSIEYYHHRCLARSPNSYSLLC